MNNFKKELSIYKNKLNKEPDNHIYMNQYAIALMENNKYEEAYSYFKKAADESSNLKSLHNLAWFYFTEGEPIDGDYAFTVAEDKAKEILKKVIASQPEWNYSHLLLGEVYMKEGNYDKAIELFLEANSIDPSLEGYSNLGGCYYFKSMPEKAAICFELADKFKNENNLSLYPMLQYGITLAELGKKEAAVEIANKLILLNDDFLEPDQIVQIYYAAGDYEKVIEIYSEMDLSFYAVDWLPPYLYALWNHKKEKVLESTVKMIVKNKEEDMKTVLNDPEEEWDPEAMSKEEYIQEEKDEINFVYKTVVEIRKGIRPEWKFEPVVETRCYLFGCKRHNNPLLFS